MPLLRTRSISMAPLLILLLPLCVLEARAGASLFVDDAAITPHGHCQVESWARAYSPGHELTAVPACNFADTEFGLGYSHYNRPDSRLWNLGVKRLFRDFGTQPWGAGVSLGATWDGDGHRTTGWTANVPVSVALDPDRNVVLHANVGWNKPRTLRGAITGGIGMEFVVAEAWTLLAELYGDHRGTAIGQFGLRRALSEAASFDLLLGHQDGLENGPWLALGFNVAFSR